MSFTNQTLKSGPYDCNGSVTTFNGTFYCLADDQFDVILTDTNGNETTLTSGTDYSINGAFPTGAFDITTTSTYASGNKITIIRNTDLTQESDFGNSGPYLPQTHETAYDKSMVAIQEVKEEVNRCVKNSVSSTAITDPDEYLAACQAAQAAAEAAAASVTATSTNLYTVTCTTLGGNITLASDLEVGDTIDGVTLAADDRVLVCSQTAPSEDGIYAIQAGGAPTRSDDYPTGLSCSGHVYTISEGTTYADTMYQCTNDVGSDVVGTNGIDVGFILPENSTDDVHWVKRSGAMAEESITTAGAALLDDANAAAQRTTLGLTTLATASVDDSSIELSGSTLQVKAGGITNAMLAAPKVKAWLRMNGTGTIAIDGSYNIDSITDNGTGQYTVTLSNAVGTNVCAVVSGKNVDDTTTDPWDGIMVRQDSTTEFSIVAGTLTPSDYEVIYLLIFE